jgi:hypothetical protein
MKFVSPVVTTQSCWVDDRTGNDGSSLALRGGSLVASTRYSAPRSTAVNKAQVMRRGWRTKVVGLLRELGAPHFKHSLGRCLYSSGRTKTLAIDENTDERGRSHWVQLGYRKDW